MEYLLYALALYSLQYLSLFAHEAGHFITLRLLKIPVTAFIVGSGWGVYWTKGGRFYEFAAFPFSGKNEVSLNLSDLPTRSLLCIFLSGPILQWAVLYVIFFFALKAGVVWLTFYSCLVLAHAVLSFLFGYGQQGEDLNYVRNILAGKYVKASPSSG